MSSLIFFDLFRYKNWADLELLDAINSIGLHSSDYKLCLRIMNHIHVVDCIFLANLKNEAHYYLSTNTEIIPNVSELISNFEINHKKYIDYISNINDNDLFTILDFVFTDGTKGRMSRYEILLHVMLHGTYHRGAVGEIVKRAGGTVPRDLFTGFLHLSEPQRRT